MALAEILGVKREDVAQRERARPLEMFQKDLRPSRRAFAAALRGPRCAYVLECKKASPSRGLIRKEFDPAAIARQYAPVAAAISVLTDEPFFQGHLSYVRAVRDAVPLPVLCKDFVVAPYQVYEARWYGADAVLIMLSVLDDAAAGRCLAVAGELGMDALVEVHGEGELSRALALGATLVGVNNRDLATLHVDLAVTERLAPQVPEGITLIGESGLRDHRDVRRLRPLVNGFLVGSAMMAAPDPGRAARALAYGRVKVCGLTRPDDARAAAAAGATFGGFIFAAESPRRVDVDRAATLVAAADLDWVGVFVNESPKIVVAVASDLGLAAVQLHGEEDAAYVGRLRAALPHGCEVWRAWRVRDRIPTLAETGADRLVLDTFAAGKRGGTGERFDWRLVDGHAEHDAMVLGGGLAPDNAAAADARGCWALDVNSGVEDAPGHKSERKLAAFFDELRGEGRGGTEARP